jgi:hypothetical protein
MPRAENLAHSPQRGKGNHLKDGPPALNEEPEGLARRAPELPA